jgi:tRNA threonylcarbamoyladenosine biosynthesis protein TsaB
MALILSIETATEVCSAALSLDGKAIALKETRGSNEHSAQLTLFIQEVLKEAGKSLHELDAIAVSMGPGSYTGLRIGVSTAKGLCFALEKPLIAVSTLKSMALVALNDFTETMNRDVLLCPMIDARRMEVFSVLYDRNLNEIRPVEALLLDEDTFRPYSDSHILVFGNGADKCKGLYTVQSNIIFPGDVFPSANAIGRLAEEKFKQGDFENTAYFEPFYLKDFIAGKPKVKGLHA